MGMTLARKPMMNDQRPSWAPDDPSERPQIGMPLHLSGSLNGRQQSERDTATYYSQGEQIEALRRELQEIRDIRGELETWVVLASQLTTERDRYKAALEGQVARLRLIGKDHCITDEARAALAAPSPEADAL